MKLFRELIRAEQVSASVITLVAYMAKILIFDVSFTVVYGKRNTMTKSGSKNSEYGPLVGSIDEGTSSARFGVGVQENTI